MTTRWGTDATWDNRSAFHPVPSQRTIMVSPDVDLFDAEAPARWRRRSMSRTERADIDLFDAEAPARRVARVLSLALRCPEKNFVVWTRDPRRADAFAQDLLARRMMLVWPANVVLQLRASTQAEVDEKLPRLLSLGAPRLAIDLSPLLGPVSLTAVAPRRTRDTQDPPAWERLDALRGTRATQVHGGPWVSLVRPVTGALEFVRIAGASGPMCPVTRVEWILSLLEEARLAKVRVFIERIGGHVRIGHETIENLGCAGLLADADAQSVALMGLGSRGQAWHAWPVALRQRQPIAYMAENATAPRKEEV